MAEIPHQKQLLNPGTLLFVAPLKDFAANALQQPCEDLKNGSYDAAAKGFKQSLDEHEDNLAAFVGLAQADPAIWPSEIKRLKTRILHDADSSTQFKLGTLYFYEWRVNPATHVSELAEAKKLLTRAWNKSKKPLIGLLYAEVHQYPSPDLGEINRVLNKLILDLAGSQAYAQYDLASRSHWSGSPPSRQIPTANLKPLRGILKEAWSNSGARFGHGVTVGNNTQMVYDPIPEERQKKFDYLAAWRKQIDQQIAKQP